MARKKPAAPENQMDLFSGAPAAVHPARSAPQVRGAEGPPKSTNALPEAWRLETNLAAFAGAGSGKTYGLVTCALHVLSGARSNKEPIEPSSLCMLTFTDKAAGEMRERLLERLEALASGDDDEGDLRASFAALGRDFPEPSFFRHIRDELGAAYIGTFHALCIQLLRQAPPGLVGLPGFTLLDERDAKALFDDVSVRLVLERVQAGDAQVLDLCRERGFAYFLSTLVKLWRSAREEGTSLELLAVGDPVAARAELERKIDEAAMKADAVLNEVSRRPPSEARDKAVAGATSIRRVLSAANLDDFGPALGELAQLWELSKGNNPTKAAWDLVWSDKKERPAALDSYFGAMRMAPHETAFRGLMVELGRRVDARMAELNALDFTALLLQARTLLRDHPEARAEAQARFSALLVDEFQDTNGVQLDLVHLLSEERSQAPRPITRPLDSDEVRALPLEPGYLCLVGDRKQGIYEFRGADVALMERAAQTLEQSQTGPGVRAYLDVSRRSTPELVHFANAVSLALMPKSDDAPKHDFEVRFDPKKDALTAHRAPGATNKPVLALTQTLPEDTDAEALRRADARAIARSISNLLSDTSKRIHDPKTGGLRPIAPGDIAILFSRFTAVQTYEQALVLAGVRHRVVRGRGFYGAQEVVDLAGMLALLADPTDRISLAAVLRSPLVGLTDAALLRLSDALGDKLDGARLLEADAAPFNLPGDDGPKLEAFRALYTRLRRERHRLRVAELLQVIFTETGFEERIAAAPHGEQALGNLEKLLVIARAADERGAGGCASLARELLDLAETEPNEAQGEVVEQGEAVTLCTIHQAKGLEWPVVVLADLPARPVLAGGWAELDRHRGLALKPWPEGDMDGESVRHSALREITRLREAAERKRLIYVALTRARDLLVLGLRKGNKGRNDPQSFAVLLDLPLGTPAAAAFVEEIDVETLPVARPAPPAPPSSAAQARVDAAIARARAPAPLAPVALLPVTHLQDFVACPRRYHYAHQIGLSETPTRVDFTEGEEAQTPDPRALGIAAHRLIERTPLETVGSQKLEPALLTLAAEEALDAPRSVIEHVLAFWETDFGKQVARGGEEHLFRELPFALELGKPGEQRLVLRGQIDLLHLDAENTAWVLDHKTTFRAPAGLEPYRFQLSAYAIAARKFAPTARAVKTGIAYLRDRPVGVEWDSPSPGALDTLEASLQNETRALLASQRDGKWEGRPVERCRAIKCGYISRCHPSKS